MIGRPEADVCSLTSSIGSLIVLVLNDYIYILCIIYCLLLLILEKRNFIFVVLDFWYNKMTIKLWLIDWLILEQWVGLCAATLIAFTLLPPPVINWLPPLQLRVTSHLSPLTIMTFVMHLVPPHRSHICASSVLADMRRYQTELPKPHRVKDQTENLKQVIKNARQRSERTGISSQLQFEQHTFCFLCDDLFNPGEDACQDPGSRRVHYKITVT